MTEQPNPNQSEIHATPRSAARTYAGVSISLFYVILVCIGNIEARSSVMLAFALVGLFLLQSRIQTSGGVERIICRTAFWIVLGVLVWPGYSSRTARLASSTPRQGKIIFRVYERAKSPPGAWYGYICNTETEVKTSAIVDFGTGVTFAKDDRIEGIFMPTAEFGQWLNENYRIYKVQGEYKMFDITSN